MICNIIENEGVRVWSFDIARIILFYPQLFSLHFIVFIKNLFFSLGNTKKGAKKECAIAAIHHLWGFDYKSCNV